MLTAQADSYSYLTFQKTDGTQQPVPVSGLVLTFSNGQLIATTPSESMSFTLVDLSKMFFSGETSLQACGLVFSSSTATAKMGEDFTPPTLANPHSLAVSWSSSNKKVATVDEEGNVTLVTAGTTTIIASFEGDDTYQAGYASYMLTIEKADPIDNGLAFSSETATAKMGEDFVAPTLVNPYDLPVSWGSYDYGVATVDDNGDVTLVAPGETIISATFAGDDTSLSGTVSYMLTVEKADPVDNGLAFSSNTATAKLGEDFTPPTLINPYDLNVTWASSNEVVATVDQSGTVTLVTAGETIISALFAGNDDYLEGTVSYTLTVEEPVIDAVNGIQDMADGSIDIYTISGIHVGKFGSLSQAYTRLANGFYVVKANGKTTKIQIRK